jgi:hypothetical protein
MGGIVIKPWMMAKPWLRPWTYRKGITLSRASGAVSNYQMKLLVGESSGATGEDVDCGGLCATDFDDIRFTKSDGTTVLDYWIESISGSTPNQLATIWIEFDSIGTGATTFYMYYGNAGAAAYSNGANTFQVFDHFDGDGVDTGIWSVKTAGLAVSGGELVFQSVGVYGLIESIASITQGAAITVSAHGEANNYFGGFVGFRQTGDWNNRGLNFAESTEGNIASYTTSGGVQTTSSFAQSAISSSHIYTGTWETNKATIIVDGSLKDTHTTNVSGGTQYVVFMEGGISGSNLYIDYVHVRKYSSTEPAWGSWGAQES